MVPTKKEPEIAVIFLHSSLTAQNWAINSGLTAPLSHLAPVIRTVITSTVIIAIFKANEVTKIQKIVMDSGSQLPEL